MKDVTRHETESFVLRRGLKWVLIPQDRANCPLLTELCGDAPSKVSVSWEDWPTLEDAVRNVRETAAGLGMSATICGDFRRQPTIILRRRATAPSKPAAPDQRINLKWCVFGEHRETWVDYGHAHVLELIEQLEPGQWLRVLSSPSKEGRTGDVVIRRTGKLSWVLSGVIADPWDDATDLADTYKVLLMEQLAAQDGPVPDDEDEQQAFLAAYNARMGTRYKRVMTERYWRSILPISAYAGEPGVELEFDRRVRGDVDRVIKVLSDLEGQVLEMSKREERWLSEKDEDQAQPD